MGLGPPNFLPGRKYRQVCAAQVDTHHRVRARLGFRLGHPELLIIDLERVAMQIETVVNPLLVIARPPGSLGEEVAIPSPQLHQRSLRSTLGNLQHPRKLISLDRVQPSVQAHPVRARHPGIHQRQLILPLPLRQPPVVGKSGHPSRLR